MQSLFSYYINEIRYRGIYLILSFLLSFVLAYNNSEILILFLTDSFSELKINFEDKLILTDMSEGMLTKIRICSFFSFCIWFFFFLYQIWAFLASSLTKSERNQLNFGGFLLVSSFLLSWLLSFYLILPFSWKFLSSFQLISETISITLEPRFQSYCLTINWILFFCVNFFLLLAGFFWCLRYNILKSKDFPHSRKIPIFCFLLLSAFFSPPEILTQSIIFLVFWLTYEFLYFLSFYLIFGS